MSKEYDKTLNLPQTDFSMRASLPQREPGMLKTWEEKRIYRTMRQKNAGKPLFIFHDGPPYANGDIHLGTALNKVLKDIAVRSRGMMGFDAEFIPGWDTHGLPIELKAMAQVGGDVSPVQLRRHCRDYALHYVDVQMQQFKRLGVLADFEDPYLTLKPEFEARQIEIFGEMAKKGYIYKGLKPVYWCPDCETALAEAEIEYNDDPCDSVYVKFNVREDNGTLSGLGADPGKVSFVIWTTTTWTLPGNVAVCLHADFEYSLLQAPGGEQYVIASELAEASMKAAGIADYKELGRVKGAALEGIRCRHPFLDRDSLVIVGEHVTLESGTGCVHTAPGHGVEDFEVCQRYPELSIVVPVDDYGRMTAEAGPFEGLTTEQANRAIADHLKETGHLFASNHILHQYPHCWRCKKPVLFRATEQWFCSVEQFKAETVQAIKEVEWIPGWGEERMIAMVTDRSDWCISRQRLWGVPIPIFTCKQCGKPHIDDASIRAVSALFRQKGSDAWFETAAADILPAGTVCKFCGGTEFDKETDIMDVWFDSGVSHAAVLDQRPDSRWPADLYLEGHDQYRGWFQSSLLTSVAWRGKAPYRQVCTHGWVVDGEGRKMSKSLGNGIDPSEIVGEYGADILRLWVASSDYHTDIRISRDILKQLSEVYRKIRNTARYILGNLYDFDPAKDSVPDDRLTELDRWALAQLDLLIRKVREAYGSFDFHIIYHAVHNFCTVDMSNFYLDVIKDRLYVEAPDSEARRAAQTAIYRILRALTTMLAPILPYTAEEIWAFLPAQPGMEPQSVMYNQMPGPAPKATDAVFLAKWDRIHMIRDDVNKALETARVQKEIGKSLEAKVILTAEGELYEFLEGMLNELTTLFIVSAVELQKGSPDKETPGPDIRVARADGGKCERCWMHSETVGQDPGHPTLCRRCAKIVG